MPRHPRVAAAFRSSAAPDDSVQGYGRARSGRPGRGPTRTPSPAISGWFPGVTLTRRVLLDLEGPPGMNVGRFRFRDPRGVVRSCGRTWLMGPRVSMFRPRAALAE